MLALVGNFITIWWIDVTTLSLLSMGWTMIATYVKGMSTTENLVITILEYGLSSSVIYMLMISKGEIESPMNLINEEDP